MTGFDSKQRMAADKLQEYDQTALELCNVCGWKTLIPGECCLNCERAQPVQEPTAIAALVEGMQVSIDVSTGEHDSGNRLFGTVTRAQENQNSKHGLILLVQDPEPNFKPAPLPVQPAQEPVAREWNFCERCGKRTKDMTTIHTCTPPQGDA